MAKYELVAMLDPRLPQDDIEALQKKIKDLFGKSILDEDEIGLLPLEFNIQGVDRAYFMSLLVELDDSQMEKIKKALDLDKWVLRYFFYKMGSKDRFFKFKELNAKLEESLSGADEISGEFGEMNMG